MEETIKAIKQRILDEQRKHPDLDWAELAALKIYGAFIKDKQDALNAAGVLTGEDAIAFEERMKNVTPMSPDEYQRIKTNYDLIQSKTKNS